MLLHPKFQTLRPTTPIVPQIKALMVQIKDLKLAIPLDILVKVIRTPSSIFKSGDKWMGMTQLDQDSLLVLDLYRKIYGTDNPTPVENLVIVRDRQDSLTQLLGIPVSHLPSMISFPADSLKPIPADYRNIDTLGIASHMVVLNPAINPDTIFILDTTRLFTIEPDRQELSTHPENQDAPVVKWLS
jgi:chemotaxis signal transduction protein